MATEQTMIYVAVGVMGALLFCAFGYFAYLTWFDKRLRAIFVDSKSGIVMTKVRTKHDNRFTYDKGIYTIDKEAIYRRFFKIPYSFYYINNPNPIKFAKQKKGDDIKAIYTSQELHDLLEVNYTLNLIRQKINVKRLVMGTTILIVIAVVVGLILQFTGVIDFQTVMLQQSAVKK